MVYVKENSIKKKIQRILEIWQERGVYDEEFVNELLKKLLGTEVYEKDKEVTRVIAEFQVMIDPTAANHNEFLVLF